MEALKERDEKLALAKVKSVEKEVSQQNSCPDVDMVEVK
jgi:hypothetical protein